MRIGIDVSRIEVSTRTGTEHYTYELLAAIARRDRQASYTLYCNRQLSALPPLGSNFQLCCIPFPRLWTHVRLSAELLLHTPDVLFVPAHVIPIGVLLSRCMWSVVTVHDMGYLHFPASHTPAQRIYLRISTLWSTRVASHIIAISAATANDLLRYTGLSRDKISIIHHGLSPRFRPLAPQIVCDTLARYGLVSHDVCSQYTGPLPYLLYVGTVQPRKNLVRLIEAFAQLRRLQSAELERQEAKGKSQNVHLVIAGKRGWLTEAIEQRAAELGVADRVHFIGYVPDHDLPSLLSGAMAFVFPSLYEGFGMPVLEAMACGAPVLTSTTSSLPEISGDAALLVDPQDTSAITAGLTRLVNDAALRGELRERGLAHAAKFTWDRCAEETLEVLYRGVR